MAVARHSGPCSALLPKSLPQKQLAAVPSSAAYVSNTGVYLLLPWLPHVLFYFLLYFSSCFYLKCVTVSKWLCFALHNLSTYSYYLFFPVCLPGITHTRFLRLRRASNAAGGGRATLSCPPPAHAYSCFLKHIFWVIVIYPKLKYLPTDVLWLPPIFF
jgi:hypothetical protein